MLLKFSYKFPFPLCKGNYENFEKNVPVVKTIPLFYKEQSTSLIQFKPNFRRKARRNSPKCVFLHFSISLFVLVTDKLLPDIYNYIPFSDYLIVVHLIKLEC